MRDLNDIMKKAREVSAGIGGSAAQPSGEPHTEESLEMEFPEPFVPPPPPPPAAAEPQETAPPAAPVMNPEPPSEPAQAPEPATNPAPVATDPPAEPPGGAAPMAPTAEQPPSLPTEPTEQPPHGCRHHGCGQSVYDRVRQEVEPSPRGQHRGCEELRQPHRGQPIADGQPRREGS